jgi:ABC-2 type transport system permease protein
LNKFIELLKIELLLFFRDSAALFWTFIFPFFILIMFMSVASRDDNNNVELLLIESTQSESEQHYFRKIETKLSSISPSVSFIKQDSESSSAHLKDNQIKIKFLNVLKNNLNNEADILVYRSANPSLYVIGLINVIELLGADFIINDQLWKFHYKKLTEQKNDTSQLEDVEAVQYMAIGLICMTILSTSFFSFSIVLVQLRATNALKMYQVMPIGVALYASAFITSRIFIMVIFSILFILVTDLLYSLDIEYTLSTLLNFVFLVTIGAMTFICIGILIASRVTSTSAANGIINIIYLPLVFLSGLFFPISSNLEWLNIIASLLPLKEYAVMFREIMFNNNSLVNFSNTLLVMFLWGGISFVIAQKVFVWNANE